MTKSWEKFIEKHLFKNELKIIINDISNNNLSNYQVTKLSWYDNYFRIRKWNIRIVFIKKIDWNEIKAVDTRWDIYKWL